MRVDVIIPALNEEAAISAVIRSIPRPPVRHVFVVDNGSTDQTAAHAAAASAIVVREPERGYGAACLAGLAALPHDTDIVVFMDGDGSDDASLLPRLIAPILAYEADFVVGSRVLGQAQPGALSPQQRLGNAIAARWLAHRFALPATDLGPFRAIRRDCLVSLGMVDRNYGWTVEMQIKAAKQGLRYTELPVPTFRRTGVSKVSGTVRGVVGASYKILGLLAYYDLIAGMISRASSRRSS